MIPGIGAAVGAIGGLVNKPKKPPRYVPELGYYQQAYMKDFNKGPMYDSKGKQIWGQNGEANAYGVEDFQHLRGYLNDAISAEGPMYTDKDVGHFLNNGRARTAGDAAAARERLNERAGALGVGPRSGMYEAGLQQIDLAELGANRGAWNALMAQEANLRLARQQAASQQLQNLLGEDLSQRTNEGHLRYNAQVARSQVPSDLQAALGGAVNGFLNFDMGMGLLDGVDVTGGANHPAPNYIPMSYGQTQPSQGYIPDTYGFSGALGGPGYDTYGLGGGFGSGPAFAGNYGGSWR